MTDEQLKLLKELKSIATMSHYYCEDCWFTCPEHPEGCCNDEEGGSCNCGANEHNKAVDDLYNRICS